MPRFQCVKKLVVLTLLCTALVTSFTSCDLFSSEDDEPKSPIDQLPPLTTTGENTFGYLLNGETIVIASSLNASAIYQGGGVQISSFFENEQVDHNIVMILLDPIKINQSYDLTNLPEHKVQFIDSRSDKKCLYDYSDTFMGSIKLSNIDRTNFIISGQFEFSTVTQGCETVEVTDGRFDLQYIP
ncbi:DUF6252 family protein [Fulvivirga lutea]|uniref:Lipoprotein n=1 Tax=Fulvivirga lutea TaxID=2810512 RepID=A0A975A1I4_9BACT|nr:DUF6252 family protein [Fulvivirga lutea]QSE97856.1 hypothetical protein JR347_01855 [Fulvivirga lutea]